jgi:hypothetical protein
MEEECELVNVQELEEEAAKTNNNNSIETKNQIAADLPSLLFHGTREHLFPDIFLLFFPSLFDTLYLF